MARKPPHWLSEVLWKEFFEDPSQWSDYRNSKICSAYPDFKHKITKKGLWIDGWYNPAWVRDELTRRGLAVSTKAENGELFADNMDDSMAFVALLRDCTKRKDLREGIRLHDDISSTGLMKMCSAALASMYAKCGALAEAQELLDTYKSRDLYAWTALIGGYAQEGKGQEALNCFEQMQNEGVSADVKTFTCLLKACGSVKAAKKGEQIHNEIVRRGCLGYDIVLGTAVVDMYAKCGALTKAKQVLEELPSRDAICWSALISGYAQTGEGEKALTCFERMWQEGFSPDGSTFTCLLKACGAAGRVDKGEQIHEEISRQGWLQNNTVLGTALVDMYAKCGVLAKAQNVLEKLSSRDVVSWNALISGYAEQGQGEEALYCFKRMQDECLSPNAVTFACTLKSCGSIGAVTKGEQIHEQIARQGLLADDIVIGTALVDMYAKCGALTKAQDVFEELRARNAATWNVLIDGNTEQGQAEQALCLFQCMRTEGVIPNAITFACILKACGSIGAADKVDQIHDDITRQRWLGESSVLGTALVDAYVKCGALVKAQGVLEELPSRDVTSWNAIITGYAEQGHREQALDCFERMKGEGLSPDEVTFACVLNACTHLALVDKGCMHFVCIYTSSGLKLGLEHYTCMIALFGRAGYLDKAVQLVQRMPSTNCIAVWSALLGACQKWEDVRLGRWAFEHAVQADKHDSAAYVLMASIYTAAGMQEEAEVIEAMRKNVTEGACGVHENVEAVGKA